MLKTNSYQQAIIMDLDKNGQHKDALIQFAKAMEINEDEQDYAFECGYTHGKLRDFDNANKYYLKAIEMDEGKKGK